MKTTMLGLLSLFVFLILPANQLLAQEALPSLDNGVSFLRAGYFYGRSGTATGPTVYVEANPIRWVGVCAIVAKSHASSGVDGGTAQLWDSSAGGCFSGHLPMFKGLLISPFGQVLNQRTRDVISIPLGGGQFYVDGQLHTSPVWTFGSAIDRAIVKDGPHWAVRIGRNVGQGDSAKYAGGIYAIGGVIFPLDHPVALGRSFRRFVGWKPSANDSSATQP
jgi:hypothetical protein